MENLSLFSFTLNNAQVNFSLFYTNHVIHWKS